MADPRNLIDAEIESFAREWNGPLPNGLLNSLGDRLRSALADASPADPLAEALESERLRSALAGVMAVTYSADDVRLLAVGFAGSKVGEDVHEKCDRMKAAHDVARQALEASADPTHLRRLLAALDRLQAAAGGDGEALNSALGEVLGAGREVRGVLGGEVER